MTACADEMLLANLRDVLDGQWSLVIDPKNVGREQRWFLDPAPEDQTQAGQGAVDHSGGVSRVSRRGPGIGTILSPQQTRTPAGGISCDSGKWITWRRLAERRTGGWPRGRRDALRCSMLPDQIKPGAKNHLAVRVLNPTMKKSMGSV